MNKKDHMIGLIAFSLTSIANAGTMGAIEPIKIWSNVITLSGGPIWANAGKQQTLYFSSELSRTYTAEKSKNTLGEGEIFLGRQRVINSRFDAQLGIAFAAASKLKLSGNIWDFEDPRFENYSNTYTVRPSRITLKGVLLTHAGHSFKPWVSAGVGIGFNKAANYSVIPLICEVEPLPEANFPNHRTNGFTYTLGAGIQRVLTENWQVGIGYEFADWGKSRLGGAPAQPLGSHGLTLNHLYTNGLLLNLTWLS